MNRIILLWKTKSVLFWIRKFKKQVQLKVMQFNFRKCFIYEFDIWINRWHFIWITEMIAMICIWKKCYGQSSEVAFPRRMFVYTSFQTHSSSQRATVIYRWYLKLFEGDKTSSELQVFRNMAKEYRIKQREYALNFQFWYFFWYFRFL